MGSIDRPVNPCAFAMGSDATFIARSMDRDPKHLKATLHRADQHHGASFVEIYQNCNIFNDGAFFAFTDKETKPQKCVFLEHGQPLVFGAERSQGIILDGGMHPKIVDIGDGGYSENDLWIHDETDIFKATLLTRFFDDPQNADALPRPFGVIYAVDRPCYEDMLFGQLESATNTMGEGDLDKLIAGHRTWTI